MIQPTPSFGRRPVRPRLCADLPLVYRSVRTVRTHDRPARRRVKARPSHRRSIACAALLSFAGASRQAQHIRRRCATRPSAGLHSHAPRPMLKPDGGRSGGVSVSGCASRTRKHALVKSRVITMRHHILPGAKRRPARPRRLSPTVRPPRQPRALSAAGRRTGCGCARVPGLLRRRAAQAVGGRQRRRDDGTDRTSGESLPLRVPEAGTGSQGTLSTPSTRSACGTPREVLLLSARTASAAAARPFLALPRPAASNSAPPAVRASLALCLSACLCAHV